MHIWVLGLSCEKTPRERRKEQKWGGRGKKKERNFGRSGKGGSSGRWGERTKQNTQHTQHTQQTIQKHEKNKKQQNSRKISTKSKQLKNKKNKKKKKKKKTNKKVPNVEFRNERSDKCWWKSGGGHVPREAHDALWCVSHCDALVWHLSAPICSFPSDGSDSRDFHFV